MNDEQSKRLADAADAVLQAFDALRDANEGVQDRRFESDAERERLSAAQQMAGRLDGAGKKIEDALRKGAIAAAAQGTAGAYDRFRGGMAASGEGRALARTAQDQDGAANKRARGQQSMAKLEEALAVAAALVFGG